MTPTQHTWPRCLFVTGTDTDIGKTVISTILMVGLDAAYWKPIQSGLENITDIEWIREKTGLPKARFFPETYRLKLPLSPHASAEHDGICINLKSFNLPQIDDHNHLIVEGAGGIMVPLNDRHFMLDLMKHLGLPILLVAPSTLGTINHTLLSLEQLRRHGLEILGVVMNGPKNPGNRKAIEFYGKIKVLAEVEPLPEINSKSLKKAYAQYFEGDLTAD